MIVCFTSVSSYEAIDRNSTLASVICYNRTMIHFLLAGMFGCSPRQTLCRLHHSRHSDGFRIGFDYAHNTCKAAKENMRSALDHPEVTRHYIARECSLGGILGPCGPQSLPEVHTSRFGVIPKGTSGKWRLILDILSPDGHSVNDGIDPDICSLTYVNVDDAARAVQQLGQGTLLVKVDSKSAYTEQSQCTKRIELY